MGWLVTRAISTWLQASAAVWSVQLRTIPVCRRRVDPQPRLGGSLLASRQIEISLVERERKTVQVAAGVRADRRTRSVGRLRPLPLVDR